MVCHLGDEQNCENVFGKQRLCVEPDLVKVLEICPRGNNKLVIIIFLSS